MATINAGTMAAISVNEWVRSNENSQHIGNE